MNNPNPFVPQGSLLEQQSKRRSRMKLVVLCGALVGTAGLMAMLIQGCKRETEAQPENPMVTDTGAPAIDTNAPAIDTNAPVQPAATDQQVVNMAPTPPPMPETTMTEYVVVKGDSFARIAKHFGVKVKAVQEANPGIEPTKLKIGQKLSIPGASSGAAAMPVGMSETAMPGMSAGGETYTVKSGDTLTKIAKTHGTTIKAIETENNLTTTKIKVGQKLKVPMKAEAPAPAPAPALTPAAPTAVAPAPPPAPMSAPAR